jgi:DNA-binding phage protein
MLAKKIKLNDLTEFDIAQLLESKRAMTEYLNQVLADGDDAELATALRHITRTKSNDKIVSQLEIIQSLKSIDSLFFLKATKQCANRRLSRADACFFHFW